MLGRWLEQFSGAAGGALFTVQVGNAEQALARISTELTSYYLLGVEPGDEDRDGRTHEISVKTTQPNVSIRGRRWVMVPKRTGGGSATTATAAPTPTNAADPAPPAAAGTSAPPPRPVVPPEVQTLADVFDRGNYDALQRAMPRSAELANTIRAFRMSDSPWPNDPKRTAVFALEIALAGLRSDNNFAREEGGRLLAEYHTRVTAAERRGCVRVLVVPDRVGSARGTLPARQRHALHPESAAALPHEPQAPPGICVRVRAAVAARRTDARSGTRSRAAGTRRR